MAKIPKPEKPLKILTIDGGGLQGISTLLILDKLLKTIAHNNGILDSKPRPCDVFDVIAGIGPGGWLALLLGRFHMDVSAALVEWYNLIECITPRSKAEKLRMRLLQHSYFDTERLVEQVDQLTDFYETDKHMFALPSEGIRCRHVFVSALKTDGLGYNLFRTYDWPKDLDLLDGASDPREYKISHAFGATGAAKYFTTPWKETSAKRGKLKFLDVQFPSPHNITELALNEMWGLYGKDVEISVVVNIGPGIPNASDCKNIARRFSWGNKVVATGPTAPKRKRSSGVNGVAPDHKKVRSPDYKPPGQISSDESEIAHRVNFELQESKAIGDTGRKSPMARQTTFGSDQNVDFQDKLRRDEVKIEDDIRKKLRHVYPSNPPPYYRLAPDVSAPGTARNDTSSPRASLESTTKYLQLGQTMAHMKEIGQKIDFATYVVAR